MSHRTTRARRPAAGFNLIELILVMAIVGIVAGLTMPALQELIHSSKMRSATRNAASILRQARAESIRRGVPCRVRIATTAEGVDELQAFADVHGVDLTDPPDGVFNPLGFQPYRSTDYIVRRFQLPAGVDFRFKDSFGADSIDPGDFAPDKEAVFFPNGAALDAGAFRFGDTRGNFLEVRVDPPSTGRISIRKWILNFGGGADAWVDHGEDGEAWAWY